MTASARGRGNWLDIARDVGVAGATLVAAVVGGVGSAGAVLTLGLFVPGLVVAILALGSGALFAALAAAWASSLLAPDRTMARLPVVVAAAEVVAALAGLVLAAPDFRFLAVPPSPGTVFLGLVAGILVTSLAAGRAREPRHDLGRQLALSAGLAALGVVCVVVAVVTTCFVVACIP